MPLTKTLDELKKAKTKIRKTKTRRKINLFEFDLGADIQFNEYSDPFEYYNFLKSKFKECTTYFDTYIRNTELEKSYRKLEYAKYEVKEFKSFYFPSDTKLLINRLEVDSIDNFPFDSEELFRAKVLDFFKVQNLLTENLLNYFNHRIRLIQKYNNTDNQTKIPTTKNHTNKNQLALFPEGNDKPLIKWTKSKAEFITLISALNESNAFAREDATLTFVDLLEFLSWSFGVEVADPYGTLKAVKNRKTNTTLFRELENAFQKIKEKDL